MCLSECVDPTRFLQGHPITPSITRLLSHRVVMRNSQAASRTRPLSFLTFRSQIVVKVSTPSCDNERSIGPSVLDFTPAFEFDLERLHFPTRHRGIARVWVILVIGRVRCDDGARSRRCAAVSRLVCITGMSGGGDQETRSGLMDDPKPNSDLNPYAPPSTESYVDVPASSFETLTEIGPIPYTGAPDEQAVSDFLRAHGHVSGCYLLVIGITLTLVLLSLSLLTQSLLLAVGGIGLVVIVLAVSTIRYRRLVFENLNPRWKEQTLGELNADGVRIQRRHSSVFFRWDWYGGAVISQHLVALLPATQHANPFIITRDMLVRLDDWDRLLEVAGAVGIVSDESPLDDARRQHNLRLLRYAQRPRSIEPPADSIAFGGALDAVDFRRLPKRYRWQERPLRSYAVVTGLFFFGSLVVIAVFKAAFQQMPFLPALILVYITLAIIGVALRIRLRQTARSRRVYYLQAFATESSLVTDFAITTTRVDWSGLRLVRHPPDRLVLRRREWNQFIVVRRDMFGSDQDWQRFRSLAERTKGQVDSATMP